MSYEKLAKVAVTPEAVEEFVKSIGATGSSCFYADGSLHVPGVTQAQLDAAVATFDVQAALTAHQWAEVRIKRNALLAATDFTQLGDYSKSNKAAMVTYRQSLRDLPQTQSDPFNIVWPVSP